MATDEGDQPADDAALARAVEDAMGPEIRRALAPRGGQALPRDAVRPPRDRQDAILDELRDADPGLPD